MNRGFTLLEVLIALTVAALALAAGMGAVGGAAQRLDQISERTLAGWALDNARSELLLAGANARAPLEPLHETLLGREFITSVGKPDENGVASLVTVLKARPQQALATETVRLASVDATP